jgi:hypothetical protein
VTLFHFHTRSFTLANTLNGNTWYIDTAHASADDDLSGTFFVFYIVVTATGANAVLELADAGDTVMSKIKLGVATSGASQTFRFDNFPIRFPNGIRVKTLTNAVATLVGTQSKGTQ